MKTRPVPPPKKITRACKWGLHLSKRMSSPPEYKTFEKGELKLKITLKYTEKEKGNLQAKGDDPDALHVHTIIRLLASTDNSDC